MKNIKMHASCKLDKDKVIGIGEKGIMCYNLPIEALNYV